MLGFRSSSNRCRAQTRSVAIRRLLRSHRINRSQWKDLVAHSCLSDEPALALLLLLGCLRWSSFSTLLPSLTRHHHLSRRPHIRQRKTCWTLRPLSTYHQAWLDIIASVTEPSFNLH
ncbi:hypothetical protein PAXRUDRAFT_318037 [Paxillus rubicundulus Ve08.2h10]|uniref:Uncharacterized protein n=1 Tax=Paxillus rubicundulus Ve08.2h10 TaxID=930991 RepID=A0A0D0DF83_9AGAM|nr:hypothetical protein PAXRUDRAFT_318037 [Paxillus rubicundulus Ve08.2h10]